MLKLAGLFVTQTYQVLARFEAAHGPATTLALSHDGCYLASGGMIQILFFDC